MSVHGIPPWFPGRGDDGSAASRCRRGNPDACPLPRRHRGPYFFPITKTTATQHRGAGGDPTATAHPSPRHSTEPVLLLSSRGAARGSPHISPSHRENLTSTKAIIGETHPAPHAAQTLRIYTLIALTNLCFPPKPYTENTLPPSPGSAVAGLCARGSGSAGRRPSGWHAGG